MTFHLGIDSQFRKSDQNPSLRVGITPQFAHFTWANSTCQEPCSSLDGRGQALSQDTDKKYLTEHKKKQKTPNNLKCFKSFQPNSYIYI